jgi:hypothetical protein
MSGPGARLDVEAKGKIPVDSIEFWRWWFTGSLVLNNRPELLPTRKLDVSERGSVCLRPSGREIPSLLGSLERAKPIHWTSADWGYLFLKEPTEYVSPEEGQNSEAQWFWEKCSFYWERNFGTYRLHSFSGGALSTVLYMEVLNEADILSDFEFTLTKHYGIAL